MGLFSFFLCPSSKWWRIYERQVLLSIFFTNARRCMTFWKVLEKTHHPNKSWVLKTGSYFQRDNFPDLLEQAVLWLRRAPLGSSGSLWTSICALQPAAPVSSVTDSPSQASRRSHPGKHKDSKALLTLEPLLSGKHLGAARYLFCDAPSPGHNGITPKLRPKTLLLLIQQMLSLEPDCAGCCSHNYLNTRMSWKDYKPVSIWSYLHRSWLNWSGTR